MRIMAMAMVLIFFSSLFTGCIGQEDKDSSEPEEVDGSQTLAFNTNFRDSIIGNLSSQELFSSQIATFEKIVYSHRQLNYSETDVPVKGGNWTHYFTCSDGEKIDYTFPMPEVFTCSNTGEVLSGEQYETSWNAFRHRELIRDIGLNSALSYYITNESLDGQLAKNILFDYSSMYTTLPILDRFGTSGDYGGRLTRQSLDEAVLLTEISWMYYLIQPMLSSDENSKIASGLIMPMVDVLNTPSNQQRNPLSNWFSYHNAGLAMAAVATSNFTLLENSLYGANGLFHQIENGFDADGFWHEGSLAYHNYTLTAMAMTLEAAKSMGVNLENYSWQTDRGEEMKLHTPFIAHLSLVRPDGTFPRLNDDILGTNLGSVLDLLEFANQFWPNAVPEKQLAQARNMAGDISINSALRMANQSTFSASLGSINLESFGASIIRNDDFYLLVDYGNHGGWHGHYDKLNVEVVTGNSTLIEDPGTVVYSLESSSEWYRNSIAHSLSFIDYANQPETNGSLLGHRFSNDYSYFIVQYRDEALHVNVTRLLFVLHSEIYGHLVLDVSNWNGINAQNATRSFHFPTAEPIYGENRSATLDVPVETQTYFDIGKWDGSTQNRTINISSGKDWQSLFYVMPGENFYSGTSINGGAFLLHSTSTPSLNSTMAALHCNTNDTGGISFDVSYSGEETLMFVENHQITLNWLNYQVAVEHISY
jgi:hypothetical protein